MASMGSSCVSSETKMFLHSKMLSGWSQRCSVSFLSVYTCTCISKVRSFDLYVLIMVLILDVGPNVQPGLH